MVWRRRLKKGLCVLLGCYVLVFVSLSAWFSSSQDTGQKTVSHLGLTASADQQQLAIVHMQEEEEKNYYEHDILLPETLDKVLQQQPGAPAARKKLSKPDQQQVNVIVEEAPPETFASQVLQSAQISDFRNLKYNRVNKLIHPAERLSAIKVAQSMHNMTNRRQVLPTLENTVQETKDAGEGDQYGRGKSNGMRVAPGRDGLPSDHPYAKSYPVYRSSHERINILNTLLSPVTASFKEFSDLVIYSAFYDDRAGMPLVRVFAIGPARNQSRVDEMWCVFNFSQTTHISFRGTTDCRGQKKYCFYMLHCSMPKGTRFTTTSRVYLHIARHQNGSLDHHGDDGVLLDVIVNRNTSAGHRARGSSSSDQPAPRFSVCIPPLNGQLSVLHLVEFVELNRVLGALHFTFYKFRVSKEISRVLAFYEEAGLARVLPWNLPAPNDVWNKGQGLAAGDCLFRNMHLFDYVVFVDVDEVFIPRKALSWKGVLESIHYQSEHAGKEAALYQLLPVTFYPGMEGKSALSARVLQSDASKFLTLRNVFRGKVLSSRFAKLLVRPDRVLELGLNHLETPISEFYVSYKVDPHLASVHHYRQYSCGSQTGTGSMVEDCNGLSEDRTVWRYKTLLLERTRDVLQRLN